MITDMGAHFDGHCAYCGAFIHLGVPIYTRGVVGHGVTHAECSIYGPPRRHDIPRREEVELWGPFRTGITGVYDPPSCSVYWGSHGCARPRGHDGPHICICAWDEDGTPALREDEDGVLNVGAPPYYGPETKFYGEGA